MIGGATTSKLHTAVKIAPNYSSPTIHVLDASRSVVVVSSLLDTVNRDDYIAEVAEEYSTIRSEYYESQQSHTYLPLAKARSKAMRIDWHKPETNGVAPKPAVTGVHALLDFPLEKLVPYIDWTPFFSVWQLRGKYPNRGYPRIFNDADVGMYRASRAAVSPDPFASLLNVSCRMLSPPPPPPPPPPPGPQAKKTFDDAQALLKRIIDNKLFTANGVFGLFPANSNGDDVVVYHDEQRTEPACTFFGLRQQEEKDSNKPYMAIGDFVAPKGSGVADYVGAFAVTCGLGIEKLEQEFEADHDDYGSIMAKALADRLAEAFAEYLHHEVRRVHWGYAPQEALSAEEMLRVKYRGIRPAPGYPSQPDHTEKLSLWKLLNVEEKTGIKLTESLAMWPAASVSGLYFGSTHSQYFAVGRVDKDQVQDYAARKHIPLAEAERNLSSILAYTPTNE